MQAHSFVMAHGRLIDIKPDFTILNIGSYDIARVISPLVLAAAVVQLAEKLVRDYTVRDVILCRVIHGTVHLNDVTPEQFKHNVDSSTRAFSFFVK